MEGEALTLWESEFQIALEATAKDLSPACLSFDFGTLTGVANAIEVDNWVAGILEAP